ncbi:MAG: bifunctional demethylmenaquinone methyltransferase/2-methoxy-6-polyprenyl-1,4-benzoquinol methylase UbiE [Xenococcaceae cyanobacterium MO_167.B27]|nr:bifunctional demethylmenaquinone methyltransferase/2-methoxy-6-polyprenyl-1,4-benzoquinol methylase UbiE [Xenococcaceae cyanobacterium MO_167.B27]
MNQKTFTSASDIQEIFDCIAPEYDRLNDRLSLGQHRIWKAMTVKWSNPNLGDTALDVCCGSGDLAFMLAQKVGISGKVVGLDFSSRQLAIAVHKQERRSQQLPLEWIEGDALALPFGNNYFDCATMGYGLRNVTNIPLSLQELHRVLKPGAKAAILDFHRPEQAYIRAFQQWYLDNIVVPTAREFKMMEQYAYLAPSLAKFPQGKEQVRLAFEVGFKQANHYPLIGGMMGVLVLSK